MSRGRSRGGFSLAEALVVLAITSALLILLFSVAGRATGMGFRLADRALLASDRAVGAESLRILLRGVRLPARGVSDAPFLGAADTLQAAVVPLRVTACTPTGPTPALRLQLVRAGGRTRLVCTPPGGEPATLLDLGPHAAAFSYALAGRRWTDTLVAQPLSRARGAAPAPPAPAVRLWVRLATDDGSFELVEAVDTPAPAPAPSAPS